MATGEVFVNHGGADAGRDPVVGHDVSLSISPIVGTATATRFELTSVPPTSGLEVGVLVDEAGAFVQVFTPDVAGEYGVKAYDVLLRQGLSAYVGERYCQVLIQDEEIESAIGATTIVEQRWARVCEALAKQIRSAVTVKLRNSHNPA